MTEPTDKERRHRALRDAQFTLNRVREWELLGIDAEPPASHAQNLRQAAEKLSELADELEGGGDE